MKVNPVKFAPANPVTLLSILLRARLNRSSARLVNPAASLIKLR